MVVNKVCGSDGSTYASECELKKASCISQKLVTVNFEGDCCKYIIIKKKNKKYQNLNCLKYNKNYFFFQLCVKQSIVKMEQNVQLVNVYVQKLVQILRMSLFVATMERHIRPSVNFSVLLAIDWEQNFYVCM